MWLHVLPVIRVVIVGDQSSGDVVITINHHSNHHQTTKSPSVITL